MPIAKRETKLIHIILLQSNELVGGLISPLISHQFNFIFHPP